MGVEVKEHGLRNSFGFNLKVDVVEREVAVECKWWGVGSVVNTVGERMRYKILCWAVMSVGMPAWFG